MSVGLLLLIWATQAHQPASRKGDGITLNTAVPQRLTALGWSAQSQQTDTIRGGLLSCCDTFAFYGVLGIW